MTWSSSPEAALRGAAVLLATVAIAPPSAIAQGAPLQLALPVICDMAIQCSIQKYFDRAAGPARQDYRCGTLTTDGHDGLDIRVRKMRDMLRNIPVVAAADGVVLRIRDGMADTDVRATGGAAMGDRLAGNAVIIDHGRGWVTQYSHLQRGSIAVKPGATVKAGARIGAIGMSGNAEFPHVHFALRKDDTPVDPFGPDSARECGAPAQPLWNEAALAAMPYRSETVLDTGFAGDVDAARSMRHAMTTTEQMIDPPSLILWASVTGARDGDEQHFTITVPSGEHILDRRQRVEKGGLDWLGYAGLRRPETGWQSGVYRGAYTLIRNGKIVGSATAVIKLQ